VTRFIKARSSAGGRYALQHPARDPQAAHVSAGAWVKGSSTSSAAEQRSDLKNTTANFFDFD
jgi:hypothetical protein